MVLSWKGNTSVAWIGLWSSVQLCIHGREIDIESTTETVFQWQCKFNTDTK